MMPADETVHESVVRTVMKAHYLKNRERIYHSQRKNGMPVVQLKSNSKDELELLTDKLVIGTRYGDAIIKHCENQSQCFLPITSQMTLKEAAEWFLNTRTFKPLILEHRCVSNRHKYFTVVRPVVDGQIINPRLERLLEVESVDRALR